MEAMAIPHKTADYPELSKVLALPKRKADRARESMARGKRRQCRGAPSSSPAAAGSLKSAKAASGADEDPHQASSSPFPTPRHCRLFCRCRFMKRSFFSIRLHDPLSILGRSGAIDESSPRGGDHARRRTRSPPSGPELDRPFGAGAARQGRVLSLCPPRRISSSSPKAPRKCSRWSSYVVDTALR